MTFIICLALLAISGSIFASHPYYPYYLYPDNRNLYPVNPPPPYLVHPGGGVYELSGHINNTRHIQSNDFVFGIKRLQDKLLLHTTIFKRPGLWSSYASKQITFPPPGSTLRVNITQIIAHDRGNNGTGGFVKMVRGGIGRENVTLLFRSRRYRPINFELDIYGTRKQ